MSEKKVLIIGANGFTGQYVYSALQKSSTWAPVSGRDLNINILDTSSFVLAVERIKPAAIINLAAVSTLNEDDIPLIYEMNGTAIIRIFDYLRKINFSGRIINASSALVYGMETPELIDEGDCLRPYHHYACAKAMADQASLLYKNQLDIVVSRPFNCIGVGHTKGFVVPKLISHFRDGASSIELGDIDVKRDFIDIRDIARMYEAVLKSDRPDPIINFCSGTATSIRDIFDTLVEITGHSMQIIQNKELFRPTENRLMCGKNNRILAASFEYSYSLSDTLRWMLKSGS